MKKKIYIIFFILIIILAILCINKTTYAAEDLLDNLDKLKPNPLGDEQQLVDKANVIIAVINIVGVATSVITLMFMGFKYMFASVEEKADYKKSMLPWLIGVIILFSATTIPNLLFNIGKNIDSQKTEIKGRPQDTNPNHSEQSIM